MVTCSQRVTDLRVGADTFLIFCRVTPTTRSPMWFLCTCLRLVVYEENTSGKGAKQRRLSINTDSPAYVTLYEQKSVAILASHLVAYVLRIYLYTCCSQAYLLHCGTILVPEHKQTGRHTYKEGEMEREKEGKKKRERGESARACQQVGGRTNGVTLRLLCCILGRCV